MKKRRSNKNNKVLLVLLGILLLCFIVLGYGFYKYFYAGTGESKYGDRLEGIENYPLNENLKEEIIALYESDSRVGDIALDIKGKIVYITIDFVETIKVSEAKDLAIKSLELIGEENLAFYEIQYILTASFEAESESKSFPVFGSKGTNSLKVVW